MPDTTNKPKVLVADDERVIADTLAMILNQSGFDAHAVYSGEKALELAPTLQPDMLITDVVMLDLNGIDAAIRIRALLPSIKILLFSGQASTADLLEKAHAQGYDFEILAKPVHPQDLLSKLRGIN
ncbi:MAG TPA: response regulator [Terracidiphilus sp.]|nr:response regulator [Terracidiphilus sp.]